MTQRTLIISDKNSQEKLLINLKVDINPSFAVQLLAETIGKISPMLVDKCLTFEVIETYHPTTKLLEEPTTKKYEFSTEI